MDNVILEAWSYKAADMGYADQAHMTREFKCWFGVTPLRFKSNQMLAKTIMDSGYC